jgi:hypothetical protein
VLPRILKPEHVAALDAEMYGKNDQDEGTTSVTFLEKRKEAGESTNSLARHLKKSKRVDVQTAPIFLCRCNIFTMYFTTPRSHRAQAS